jgi:hypothetical protein
MKYVISLMLCWSGLVLARPIRIFYEGEIQLAQKLSDELAQVYLIPRELMSVKWARECGDLPRNGKLDLCIKNNGDLEVVSVDQFFIESIRIFRAPREEHK